ncbi:MAG TPA: carbohydrate ABC transporter substrate-binding protein [Chloroflexi bacterium]|nr:carbohydrate ABC transporter substrate-binding protein [Chloroflexota bacterium]
MSDRKLAVLTVISILALVLSACATPTAEIVVETVQVEVTREVEVPVEVTQVVREEVEVTTVPPALEGPYEHLARARAGEFAGTEVNIFGVYTGEDANRFRTALVPFEQATGINVTFEGSGDFETLIVVRAEGGNPPDIAQFSQPGLIARLTDFLVPLDSFMNMDQLQKDYIQSWLDFATFDEQLYGLFYRASTKSLVWYPTPQFSDAGYEVPETWDELIALMDEMVANGHTPWCIPIEHGGSTGWVATDWVEDILLRTAPPEIYDQWITNEIPFDHPALVEALDYMATIWHNEDYVYGGPEAIVTTFVGQTDELFPAEEGADPECWMMKQAGWIPAFFPEGIEAGTDAMFFYFPPIKEEYGKPVLGGGDPIGMFNDRPEVRAVMEYLATPAGAEVWIKTGGFNSPNRSVPLNWYTNDIDRLQGEIMKNADVFRFDASDLMPGEVGTGTFWSGMVEWTLGEKDAETMLREIDESWPE